MLGIIPYFERVYAILYEKHSDYDTYYYKLRSENSKGVCFFPRREATSYQPGACLERSTSAKVRSTRHAYLITGTRTDSYTVLLTTSGFTETDTSLSPLLGSNRHYHVGTKVNSRRCQYW
jgi:hypothetical protein